MYFDFEDGHPDLQRVPSALTAREGVMLSIIVHLVIALLAVLVPKTEWWKAREAARQAEAEVIEARLQQKREDQPRFVFMQPQVELAPQRPPRQDSPLSDRDRSAMSPEKAPVPSNPQPFSRGNTPEYIQPGPPPTPPRSAANPGPQSPPTEAPADAQARAETPGERPDALRLPDNGSRPPTERDRAIGGRNAPTSPDLGRALRDLSRYAEQAARDNPNGGGTNQFGFQFDSKGANFGPWLRRFAARVRANWYSIMPQTAQYLRGHVVITFNVARNGALDELTVIGPSEVDSFNNAAFNALAMTNPADQLPADYPSDRLFITVTFYYNETPPSQ